MAGQSGLRSHQMRQDDPVSVPSRLHGPSEAVPTQHSPSPGQRLMEKENSHITSSSGLSPIRDIRLDAANPMSGHRTASGFVSGDEDDGMIDSTVGSSVIPHEMGIGRDGNEVGQI